MCAYVWYVAILKRVIWVVLLTEIGLNLKWVRGFAMLISREECSRHILLSHSQPITTRPVKR